MSKDSDRLDSLFKAVSQLLIVAQHQKGLSNRQVASCSSADFHLSKAAPEPEPSPYRKWKAAFSGRIGRSVSDDSRSSWNAALQAAIERFTTGLYTRETLQETLEALKEKTDG